MKRVIVVFFAALLLLALFVPVGAQAADCDSSLSEEEYLNLSLDQYGNNQIQEAIASTECLIAMNPANPIYHNNRGFLSQILGDYATAIDAFGQAVEADPNYAQGYANRGSVLAYSGQYEASIADFLQAQSLDPSILGPVAHNDWALSTFYIDGPEAAIELVNIALEMDPQYLQALENRGAFQNELGNYDAAIADLSTVIENAGDGFPNSYAFIGDAYYFTEQFDAAIEAYNQYVALTGTTPQFIADRLAEMQGGTTVAEQPAMDCDPEVSGGSYEQMGANAIQDNDLQTALGAFSCAIAADPEEPVFYSDRGYAYLLLGDVEASEADLLTALDMDPELPIALGNLTEVYYQSGQFEKALEIVNRSLAIDPGDEFTNQQAGFIYAELGDYESALPHLIKSVSDAFIVQPRPMAALAFSFYELGDTENAFTAYEQLLQIAGEENLDPFVLERIDELEAALGREMESAYICGGIVSTGNGTSLARDFARDAQAAIADNDFEEGLEIYECVIKAYPFSSTVHSSNGYFLSISGNEEAAQAEFAKALELDPTYTRAYALRGTAALEAGNLPAALEDINAAYAVDPNDANIAFLLAKWYLTQDRFNEALYAMDAAQALFGGVEMGAEAQQVVADAQAGYESIALDNSVTSADGSFSIALPAELASSAPADSPENIFVASDASLLDSDIIELDSGDTLMMVAVGDATVAGGSEGDTALDIISATSQTSDLDYVSSVSAVAVGDYMGYQVDVADADFGNGRQVLLDLGGGQFATFNVAASNEEELDAFIPTMIALMQSFALGDTAQEVTAPVVISAEDQTAAEDLIGQGSQLLNAGDLDGAIAIFTSAIELDPNNLDGYIGRSNAYGLAGENEAALADMESLLAIDDQFADAYLQRGVLKANLGEFEGAIADLETYLDMAGSSADPQTEPFIEELRQQLASGTDEPISEADQDAAFELYQEGTQLAESGDLAGAIAALDQAVELDPARPQIMIRRGQIHKLAGNFDQSLADFDQAIELDPGAPAGYYQRASLLVDAGGDLNEALADVSTAIDIAPGEPGYWFERAYIQGALGEFEAAIEDLDYIIEEFGPSARASNERGTMLMNLGRADEAEEEFSRGIALDTERSRPLLFAARGMARLNNEDPLDVFEAMDDFECYKLVAGDNASPGVLEQIEQSTANIVLSGYEPVTDAAQCVR